MITRRKPPDSRIERQIITGMIISDRFLKEIAPIYRLDCLRLPYARSVATWCMEYFKEYNCAPGKHIQDLFLVHKSTDPDPDRMQLVEQFLAGLSEEYETAQTFNVEYILDKTELHFRKVALEALQQKLIQSVAGGRVEDAEALIAGFDRVTRPKSVGINPVSDPQIIAKAFSKESGEQMFSLPGDLGRMIGHFERKMFTMVVGPMGRGKSWWLQEIALRALFSGFHTLFVSLEMSESQMTRRIQHNLTGLPKEKWAGEIHVPVFDCKHNQTGECKNVNRTGTRQLMDSNSQMPEYGSEQTGYKICTACREQKGFEPAVWYKTEKKDSISISRAITKGQALASTLLRGGRFKLITPPPNSLNVSGLRTMLDNWEYYEGWIPDVIVTDYADKFAPEDSYVKEYRHRIYQSVLAHKALAMERNCFVVSGSQSNTGRDDNKRVRSGDFAEDIRKKAEIDIAFSLNQLPEEKQKGMMKIAAMKIRDDDFDVLRECLVLQQLKIGRPYLDSYYGY